MIRFYDKTDKKYFEFSYIDVEKLKLNDNLIFITDKETNDKIDKIEPFLRNFIRIDNNEIIINYDELKNDILIQLKVIREEVFKYLDSQFFQISEKIAVEENVENIKLLKEELKKVIDLKDKWRNIDLHEQFNNLSSIKSYSEIINLIRKDIDPLYIGSNEESTILPM
jgi:hypothetical protein